MRVVIACDWFLKYGGRLCVAVRAAGADVALVCRSHALEFGDNFEERELILEDCRAAGVEVLELGGRFTSIQSLGSLARLAKTIRRWRPDVFHAQDNYDPRLLAVGCRYPVVLTIHDVRPHLGANDIGALRRRFRNGWIRVADRLVVHGSGLRAQAEARFGTGRVAVIPHGLDPLARPLPVPARPTVLMFGRLEPYKGLDVLLEAMDLVWAIRPDIRLMVVGDGPEAARIPKHQQIVARIGYLPEAEVDALLREASVVVLPYVTGSQSGVGSLAVSRGVPALVTRVGSLPDLTIGSSFVLSPRDPRALASALLRYADHSVDLRRAVLNHARKHLSWDVVGRMTMDVYRDVVGASAQRRSDGASTGAVAV